MGVPQLHALVLHTMEPTGEGSPEAGSRRMQLGPDQHILWRPFTELDKGNSSYFMRS